MQDISSSTYSQWERILFALWYSLCLYLSFSIIIHKVLKNCFPLLIQICFWLYTELQIKTSLKFETPVNCKIAELFRVAESLYSINIYVGHRKYILYSIFCNVRWVTDWREWVAKCRWLFRNIRSYWSTGTSSDVRQLIHYCKILP